MSRLDRRHQNDAPDDLRSRFERDRDRILYSSYFRRLVGITQVVSPTEFVIVHNRLTHSLEVAQIARRMAQYLTRAPRDKEIANQLGGIDPDVVEAAALAHDLGHPPFGHIAEEILTREAQGFIRHGEATPLMEGFNGNAQSFRILTKLGVRQEQFFGLNLTRAVLTATLKYPYMRTTHGAGKNRWGVYSSEAADFGWAREGVMDQPRSVEADIVDWADDVAYAVHDLEDFIRAGLIPMDRLVSQEWEGDEFQRFLEANQDKLSTYSDDELREAYDQTFGGNTFDEYYRGTRENRFHLRTTTSNLITRFVAGFHLNSGWNQGDPRSRVDRSILAQVALLKRLTWFYVIDNPSVALQQEGHKHLIQTLFNRFANAAFSNEPRAWSIFPDSYRERIRHIGHPQGGPWESLDDGLSDDEQRIRLVVDFIASMTEAQAVEVFRRMTNTSPRSAIEVVIS